MFESYHIWIVVTAAIIAMSNALLGVFIVLQKKAMIGDAISHSVLPGIVVSFLIFNSRSGLLPILGAAVAGFLTVVIIEWLSKKIRIKQDAATGIAYSFFFAIGIAMISYGFKNIDLDQECVLYGEIGLVIYDNLSLGNDINIPRQFFNGLVALITIITLIILFYKPLFFSTFDPNYAKSVGINESFWQYFIMFLISITAVLSFEAVGAIMVVGLLSIPANFAILLSKNLKIALFISAIFAVVSCLVGYLLAALFNVSIAGAIVVFMGIMLIFEILVLNFRKN